MFFNALGQPEGVNLKNPEERSCLPKRRKLNRSTIRWLLPASACAIFMLDTLITFAQNSSDTTTITIKDTTTITIKKEKRIYHTVKITGERPKIDGVLNDACWEQGEWASDFTQWIPKEGGKPSQQTDLKILYDDKNIFVAIRAHDNEPQKIHRKAGRRDEFAGDLAGVTFDSYHDHRTGFEFDVTAAGQKTDLVLTNPMEADFNWNAVWFGKSSMEDSAWTAEMQIPLSQLRYSKEEEQIWGLHCWRWIERLQEEDDWEFQSVTSPGMLYLFGEMYGIKGLKKFRHIELMPYVLGSLNTFQKDQENPYARTGHSFMGNAGLNAKIGITSNFTADLAINPDFGQVESDPSVMNLTAFEPFFEEKRPFFLEGKSIFDFLLDDASLFYSRRIGHAPSYQPDPGENGYVNTTENTTILSAVKLSGKTSKGLSVGVMQSFTASEHADIFSNDEEQQITTEPFTNYFVGRIQQDIHEGNTVVGGIFTATNRFIKDDHLNFLNKDAFTGGFDLLHQWHDKEFYFNAKIIGSNIQGDTSAITALQRASAHYYQRPDAEHLHFDNTLTQLSGEGGSLKIGKGSKGFWRYSTALNWRSPGLELNDVGYMQVADIINQENEVSYLVNQPTGIFRTYNVGFQQFNNWDFGLNYLASGAGINLYLEFLNKMGISPHLNFTSQSLDTRILRGGDALLLPSNWSGSLYYKTDYSKKLYFDLNADFSLSGQKRLQSWSLGPKITYLPFNRLKISSELVYSSNIDQLQYIDQNEFNDQPRYILGKIDQQTLQLTFRFDFNITPEISLQYYGSPFASSGRYSDFKFVSSPKAANYNDRFTNLDNISLVNGEYQIDEDQNGQIDYTFQNPDFDFYQFRSNLVFRWEYLPGSQLYLVWSNERTNFLNPGDSGLNHTMEHLSEAFPNNVFLIKLNYWFPI